MDLKTFGEGDFDAKQWINKAWRSSGNQEKEIFVANTVSRLQLYMKQLTNSLDETTTQIVTSIPRILQDASALQLEGAMLQQKLLSLEQKVQSVEEQTGHSIESLQKIDQLKSRLETAASALREADKWAALATSLEDILESGVPTQGEKLAELSEQVSAMTASLEVLSEAPDYENKRLQLETLYNRLEAAISPPLIEALTQMDAERTATYVSLFSGMGRAVSVCRCWRRAAAARLANSWRRLDAHTLAALTRMLATEAGRQVDWLTNVLKSETPLAELIRLYTDLLLSLDPPPTKVVSANLKLCSSPEEGILLLTDLRNDIEDFITCIEGVIDAPRQNKETLLAGILREFGRAAYAPLRELLPKYTELQSQLLLNYLNDPQLKQEDLLELSRAILTVSERCEGWLVTAQSRARKIAGDAMYPYYMPAVENFISSLSSLISSHSRRIESTFLSSATSGQTTGVLSSCFPASLMLQTAAANILETLASMKVEEETKHLTPLHDLPTLLLEAEVRQRLPSYRAEPPASAAGLRRSAEQLRGLARAVLRNPVDVQLEKIPQLSVWNNNDALSTDLPDFALSPQEYITEIGQYLMTLPQHLELHLSEKQAPLQFLSDVCTHTCEVYAEKILNIRNMDALGTKRCLNDIVYLSSVVEDLGSTITPSLRNLEKSLRAATPSPSSE
ncbi:conserved oligomeric Golgi complex subunit 7 isoform X3 [Helicoverpa zea]|uniref:conserved oligomeric Golgi complex subunit 7 isoform X1 n=1 Tax=Helicoverpa zea TaxID=7113 RepID=UPI001F5A96AB|nr:conserved oligomeric Golgi complex subunit 7 isoform X1 [Helicoverpa zea]XP_047039231.1 conserved oligomeric Golgi complex subunit 7 isoform X2 [Helicoverpa zea]XP_047039232.1 conserved oligomeric Golgi complex subunit 7 isoform X3 [Helicoverpa zea]